MNWLGLLLGMIFGAASLGGGGAVLGAMVGWMLSREAARADRVKALEAEVAALARLVELRTSEPRGPDPAIVEPWPGIRRAIEKTPTGEPASSADVFATIARATIDATPATGADASTAPATGERPATDAPGVDAPAADAAGAPATTSDAPATAGDAPGRAEFTAAEPAAKRRERQPAEPELTAFERQTSDLIARALRWMMAGNPAVKVGVVVLFIGMAFLLKYTADYIPLELRYLAVLGVGAAAIVFGWKQRTARRVFALTLQGAGVALGFLAVFAAFRLHALIPGAAAFALLAGIAVLSAALAIVQEARTLIVLGIAGGFLAPILASTGQGSHVALFAYYAVLNLGIAVVARYRSWRALNVLGFCFTFVIGAAWGVLKYRPEFFVSTEPFLIGFFIFYVALAIAHARRLQEDAGPVLMVLLARDPVDATLVFGVPLVGFGLQAQLVSDIPYGTAWSAAALAAGYAILWLGMRRRVGLELLAECFLALAIGFATVTIPLAGGASWTASSWALEGAGLVWVGCRQNHWFGRLAGYALIGAAACLTAALLDEPPSRGWQAAALGTAMVTAAAWLSGAALARARARLNVNETIVIPGMLALGLGMWLGGGAVMIDRLVARPFQPSAGVALVAGTAALLTALAPLLRWPALRLPLLGLTCALLVTLGVTQELHSQLFARLGWLAWTLAFVVHLGTLRIAEHDLPALGRRLAHASGVWLFALVLTWGLSELVWLAPVGLAWPWCTGLVTIAAALAVLRVPALYRVWPAVRERDAYAWLGALPVAAALYLGLWITPWSSAGDPRPLAYLPLLNPLDLAVAVALVVLIGWARGEHAAPLRRDPQAVPLALGAVMFAWANAMLARGFHHHGGVRWDIDVMLRSTSFHAGLSLLWTSVALGLMFTANRRGWRRVWMIGAALIGLTVLKLFVVDLSVASGLARIVSFIGVGLLLVAVGWFAPVPPRRPA